MEHYKDKHDPVPHTLPDDTVVIAGGGPIGLLLARVLSFYGVRSILFERNRSTTTWPKMDLTNVRSMELFRKLGLADDLRRQGVPADLDQDVLISSGLSMAEPITKWSLPSVDKFRQTILETNDGSQPLEPWQRLSQVIFEKWFKAVCDQDPLIDLRYGWRVDSVQETSDEVRTSVSNTNTGVAESYVSRFVAGCDGAGSKVRRLIESPLDGGPIPMCVLLIHFKSRDLQRLWKQGRFWHIFFVAPHGGLGSVIISQDEIEIFTVHLLMPLDAEIEQMDSKEAIYQALGGLYEPFDIEIDEILVRSVWRPKIAVTRTWHGSHHRIFLAGDSAHQTIPTGAYGMNMGIGDAFDLGWKLAAVINGEGGPGLLHSYELERRPVALRNVEHSGAHFKVHQDLASIFAGGNPKKVDEATEEGRTLRDQVHQYYQQHDGENRDFGIELGYRYTSPVILRDANEVEPEFDVRHFTSTTWPGGRAPSLFLSDGSALYDRFGKHWTLVTFSNPSRCGTEFMTQAAKLVGVPLELLDLSGEIHAAVIYEKPLVLIRPDQHVAWRAHAVDSFETASVILKTVTGRHEGASPEELMQQEQVERPFTSTTETTSQTVDFTLERMGEFQK